VADAVLTSAREGVLEITLNRPEARNAYNVPVVTGLEAALDRLRSDDALRVGIITGAGGNFCSGMDLKVFAAGDWPYTDGAGFATILAERVSKPLIAALEGYAVAGGFELALVCDLIVAARDAKVGIPEVKRSVVAVGGGLIRLPRRVPYHLAMELALTGEFMDAERAFQVGLVNRLTDPGEAMSGARELAATISQNGPLALSASKEILASSQDWTEAEAWKRQYEIAAPVLNSEDAREGATAFAEKRAARWQAR